MLVFSNQLSLLTTYQPDLLFGPRPSLPGEEAFGGPPLSQSGLVLTLLLDSPIVEPLLLRGLLVVERIQDFVLHNTSSQNIV